MTTDVLLTCPPMILHRQVFAERFEELEWRVHVPEFEQIVPEHELVRLVPEFSGWIIGDDPATARVVEAGVRGRLRAAVKWGVGVDNVDFSAFERMGVAVSNTPAMFGKEVADVVLGYVIALARHTFEIDRGVRAGRWPKPSGISLADRCVVLVGFGDIGRNTASRLRACDMRVVVCDPAYSRAQIEAEGFASGEWPRSLEDADFVVLTCALTAGNRYMLGQSALGHCKPGLRVINVARGPLVDEGALVDAQRREVVGACALDVFEQEPLSMNHPLRKFPANVFGSHNASNTVDAVLRASHVAIDKLHASLQG